MTTNKRDVINYCKDPLIYFRTISLLCLALHLEGGSSRELAENECHDGLGSVSFPLVYLCWFRS